jgi:hypothetical protein
MSSKFFGNSKDPKQKHDTKKIKNSNQRKTTQIKKAGRGK